ncbi:hypothetical protein L9F63_022203, partial [Diploptera punctata]
AHIREREEKSRGYRPRIHHDPSDEHRRMEGTKLLPKTRVHEDRHTWIPLQ